MKYTEMPKLNTSAGILFVVIGLFLLHRAKLFHISQSKSLNLFIQNYKILGLLTRNFQVQKFDCSKKTLIKRISNLDTFCK